MAWELITIGDIVSETDLKQHGVEIYQNSMVAVPTGNTAADGSLEYEVVSNATLKVIGQDGLAQEVSQGFGLGVRQHDDVMLSFGYTRFTRALATIPSGDFFIIRLNINDVNQHHVEQRSLNVEGSSLNFTVIEVDDTTEFPTGPTAMPIINNNGPVIEVPGVDVKAEFFYYPIQGVNPFTLNKVIDDRPVFVEVGAGPFSGSPDFFASAKGRHYTANKTYAVIIENIGASDAEVYYQYEWHEY